MLFRSALTFLPNRRQIVADLQREVTASQDLQEPLTIFMLDLDHFKLVNDQWGHQAGDEALVEVVRTVTRVLRQGDSLVRWGGDEFVVLCPGVGALETEGLGEKIVTVIRANPTLARWDWV